MGSDQHVYVLYLARPQAMKGSSEVEQGASRGSWVS